MLSKSFQMCRLCAVILILVSSAILTVQAGIQTESESRSVEPDFPVASSCPPLPKRKTPPPRVTLNIPHRQVDVKRVSEVNKGLCRRAFSLPGVENRPTILSVPVVRVLWLSNRMGLVHPEIIRRGREFAHIHEDGSMRIAMEPKPARDTGRAGWTIPHPMSIQEGWDGFVLLYTP